MKYSEICKNIGNSLLFWLNVVGEKAWFFTITVRILNWHSYILLRTETISDYTASVDFVYFYALLFTKTFFLFLSKTFTFSIYSIQSLQFSLKNREHYLSRLLIVFRKTNLKENPNKYAIGIIWKRFKNKKYIEVYYVTFLSVLLLEIFSSKWTN